MTFSSSPMGSLSMKTALSPARSKMCVYSPSRFRTIWTAYLFPTRFLLAPLLLQSPRLLPLHFSLECWRFRRILSTASVRPSCPSALNQGRGSASVPRVPLGFGLEPEPAVFLSLISETRV